jgi:hypothetical protein
MSSISYIHKCEVCNAANKKAPKQFFNQYELEMFLHSIYLGDFNKSKLPTTIYLKIAKELEQALNDGFGIANNENQIVKVSKMRRNVYYFAAAKTYIMVSEIEPKKENKTYSEFKLEASPIVADFLGAYLSAELDHSLMVGKAAKKWVKLVDRKSPAYLEYVTMKDNHVRPAHVYLDGIIRKQDDNFWNTFTPPNGWNCRCKIKSYPRGENTSLRDFDMEEAYKNVPVMFRMNFGKEGIVFPHDHPYFKNVDKELARKNFNLPLPYNGK